MKFKYLYLFLTLFSIIGCKKNFSCYDKQMEKNHSGICTMDCPGVCGCDGKEYCNECIANSKGISVVKGMNSCK